jgi:hypothetical protein
LLFPNIFTEVLMAQLVKEDYLTLGEQESLARVLLMLSRKFGSTGLHKPGLPKEERNAIFRKAYDRAAQEKGFAGYDDLPEGTKRYLASGAGKASAWMFDEIDRHPPEYLEMDLEEPNRVAPRPVFPLSVTHWFRQKACRHSWWYPDLQV